MLSALPWVGQELYQKKEKDLDNLLSQIGSYIQLVQFSVMWNICGYFDYCEYEIVV